MPSSRVSLQEKGEIKGLDITIHEHTPPLTRVHVEQIQKAIQGDKTLQLLIQEMLECWPEHHKNLPIILKPFCS